MDCTVSNAVRSNTYFDGVNAAACEGFAEALGIHPVQCLAPGGCIVC